MMYRDWSKNRSLFFFFTEEFMSHHRHLSSFETASSALFEKTAERKKDQNFLLNYILTVFETKHLFRIFLYR